jgi:hypothetical protein
VGAFASGAAARAGEGLLFSARTGEARGVVEGSVRTAVSAGAIEW